MAHQTSAWGEESAGALLEGMPDAMVVIDDDGVIVLANAVAHRMFGYEAGELIGHAVEVLIPSRLEIAHRKHRKGYAWEPRIREMGSGLELKGSRKDGSEFSVEISLSPMQTNAGLLVAAAIRDTTHKRREDRLFRGLLEAAPDAMVIVDQQGQIVLVNAQVESMFGYDRNELIGRSVETLMPARFSGLHEHYRRGYVTEPRARPMGLAGDLYACRRDGSEFPVEVSLAPLETDDGMLISAAVRDITERRALADAADRAKDEFFATVSHELRTPLTSLIGYGELMQDLEELTVQGRRFLSVMMRSAEREMRLVNDLLTLVQIEGNAMPIQLAPLDLNGVLMDSVEAARPHAEEFGISLGLSVAGTPVVVPGDRDRLGQAVDNVVSNALKFTPAGGSVRVELSIDHQVAHVDVLDTGPGITDTEPERLFERLYRAPTAVAKQVPGAGLGLTIALAIARAHGGTIAVTSTGEHGTTFRITLPLQP